MQNCKKDEEVLAEVYRNVGLAIESITDLFPLVDEGEMKEELKREHEEYQRIEGKCVELAKQKGIEMKQPSAMKKVMMKGAIKMNAAIDNSQNHVAEMMIKGTVQGITCLKTTLSENENCGDGEITALLKELVALEERFEATLKKYL